MKKGFTLVELVIVIVIVGILSIVAVPIYKGYVEKAKLTEAKALVSAIRTAQMVYYAEYGAYYSTVAPVDYDQVLQIDARGNKYFKTYTTGASVAGVWQSSARDSVNAEDYVNLYWNIDNSAPAIINGHQLPVFGFYIDGDYSYTNS